eukprot:TRINITY_DN11437_c0_g1_i3.p1 TRINITY_DN11437_c0_g1~~TRINITY_DN11437_c0_g1_i3.p1  ORF type:complete len:688 (-),score=271.25 TRINITY_DN11437_c0_g1_i3:127-2190(-)
MQKTSQISDLQLQVEVLEAQLSHVGGLSADNELLKGQLSEAQHRSEIVGQELQHTMNMSAHELLARQLEISDLEDKLETHTAQLKAAETRVAVSQANIEELSLGLEKSKREVQERNQEKADLARALERVQEEGAMVRNELRLQRDLNTSVSSRDCIQSSRFEQLQQQLRSVEQQQQAGSAEDQATIAALKVELQVDRATVTRIKQLAQMHQAETASLSGSVTELTAQLQAAHHRETQAAKLVEEFRSTKLDTQSHGEQQERRITELQAELSTAQHQATVLANQLAERRAEEGSSSALQEQLQQQHEQLDHLQGVAEENRSLSTQIELLEAQITELNARAELLEDSESLSHETASTNQTIITKLRSERAQMEQELSTKIERYERTQKAHLEAHKEEVHRLSSVAEALQQQLEEKESQESATQAELTASMAKTNELLRLLNQREQQISESSTETAQSRRQADEHATDFEELRQRNAVLMEEKGELIEATSAAIEAGELVERQVVQLHSQNKQLAEDMQEASNQLANQARDSEQLRESHSTLQRELQITQEQLASVQQSYSHLSSTVSKEARHLEVEADERRLRLSQAEEAISMRSPRSSAINISKAAPTQDTMSTPPVLPTEEPAPALEPRLEHQPIWASPIPESARDRIVETSLTTPSPHVRPLSERSPGFARLQALAKELDSPAPAR